METARNNAPSENNFRIAKSSCEMFPTFHSEDLGQCVSEGSEDGLFREPVDPGKDCGFQLSLGRHCPLAAAGNKLGVLGQDPVFKGRRAVLPRGFTFL